MIESTNRAWKACLLALSFLFAPIVSNAELPVGSTPKTIVLQGEQGKLVDGGGPWKSDRFKGFVTILFYVDPDESDLNNASMLITATERTWSAGRFAFFRASLAALFKSLSSGST